MCLQIKQLRIDVPAGTIQPTHQRLVRDAHSAAESVLPSSACAAIYGVMSHVHISNTPSSSSTNVIVELYGLLQASKFSAVRGSVGVRTPPGGSDKVDKYALVSVFNKNTRRVLSYDALRQQKTEL